MGFYRLKWDITPCCSAKLGLQWFWISKPKKSQRKRLIWYFDFPRQFLLLSFTFLWTIINTVLLTKIKHQCFGKKIWQNESKKDEVLFLTIVMQKKKFLATHWYKLNHYPVFNQSGKSKKLIFLNATRQWFQIIFLL